MHMLILVMKRKHHDEGLYEGLGSPQIKSIRVKCEMDRIKNHFAGPDKVLNKGL